MYRHLVVMSVVAVVGVLLGTGAPASDASERPPADTALLVKATMLWKFGGYCRWEKQPNTRRSRTFVIGVLGEDPFEDTLERSAKGRRVDGRSIEFLRVPSIIEAEDREARLRELRPNLHRCHVLFVCSSERAALASILEECKDRPILTMSDIPSFARRGGMVELVTARETVAFDLGLDAFRRVKLKIDPEVVAMARKTYGRR